MAIQATLEGNLTRNPEGKCIVIDGVPRDLVEMRVFSDVNRRNAEGGWVQDDERSGAVDVTIWAEKLGAEVLRLFRKGARVLVTGQLHLHEYVDTSGERHAMLRMTADAVGLQPYRIETLDFRPPRDRSEAAAESAAA